MLTGVTTPATFRVWLHLEFMSDKQNKIVVILDDEEHATLKEIVAESRRTLGQELAFRAFQSIAERRRKEAAIRSRTAGPKRALRGHNRTKKGRAA